MNQISEIANLFQLYYEFKKPITYKMSLAPPVLNPSTLYKEEAKRDATRIKIYNGVLTQIYNKVKAVARIAGNEKALWYVVPEFLPGYPRFDTGDAIIYIVWNLRNTGYTVHYTHPNLLYITWKAYDERYHKIDSPWSQVLQSAKSNIERMDTQNSIFLDVPKQQSYNSDKTVEVKRKTILKKTMEYQPLSDVKPMPYNQVPAQQKTGTQLPGQLSDRHISFV